MIVEVFLRITDDTGIPYLLANASELYVQRVADFEANLLGSMALLDQTAEHAKERLLHQAQQYREAEGVKGGPPPERGPEWRPPER